MWRDRSVPDNADFATPARWIGRYALFSQIGSGGMSTVYLGRQVGSAGFSKTVAVKLLHAPILADPASSTILQDEARTMSRIRHVNVVNVLDLVIHDNLVALVMDYVPGLSLARILDDGRLQGARVPSNIAVAIFCDVLRGLHAAHAATDSLGNSLQVVHRDVSPQNILVGSDGISRVLDFGIAKAIGRLQSTRDSGTVKGKTSYMAPEQIRGSEVDARADIWAASVVLWECLTSHRLFQGDNPLAISRKVLSKPIDRPSAILPGLAPRLDDVVLRGLERSRERRFTNASEMVQALEEIVAPARSDQVRDWMLDRFQTPLREQTETQRTIEALLLDAPPDTRGIEPLQSFGTATPSPTLARSNRRLVGIASVLGTLLVLMAGVLIARSSSTARYGHRILRADAPHADRSRVTQTAVSAESASIAPRASAVQQSKTQGPMNGSNAPKQAPGQAHSVGATQCDPPYVVAPDGMLKVKTECM